MKKVLALFLALIMITAVVPMSAYAEEMSDGIINGATITFDTDKLVGIAKKDIADVISVDNPGLEIDYDSISVSRTGIGGFTDENDKFEYAVIYSVMFKLYPAEGYSLSENSEELRNAVKVEGRKCIKPNDENADAPFVNVNYSSSDSDKYDEYINIRIYFRPTGPAKVIESIDINFDNNISGKTIADYKEFVSVVTEGVEMGDKTFYTYYGAASGVPGSMPVETFEPGGKYFSYLYIYPEEGYVLTAPTKVNVNGNSVKIGSCDYEYVNYMTSENCKYIRVELVYDVKEPELTSTEKFLKSISDFFKSISDFFNELYVDFFAVLNELFTNF